MTIELTVLGAGAPFPTPGAPACSGYLLRSKASTVWVETGPGTLARLLEITTLADIDAIWISHLHADHTADIVLALYALDDGAMSSGTPLPVFAPSGFADRIGAFLGKDPATRAASIFGGPTHLAAPLLTVSADSVDRPDRA